jgi:predicted RNase H-like HicB family nuclease
MARRRQTRSFSNGGSRRSFAAMKFVTTLERDEDGVWVAECPSIPGCVSQGKNREEALENIREAIAACLEVRAERGLPLTVETQQVEAANQSRRTRTHPWLRPACATCLHRLPAEAPLQLRGRQGAFETDSHQPPIAADLLEGRGRWARRGAAAPQSTSIEPHPLPLSHRRFLSTGVRARFRFNRSPHQFGRRHSTTRRVPHRPSRWRARARVEGHAEAPG